MLLHVTYMFQIESRLYSCLNVKELLARNSRDVRSLSDSNGIRTHNHLNRKWALNYLPKLAYIVECSFTNYVVVGSDLVII